eukprot:2787340-Pyramimonas_sp.AAC.1
MSLRRRPMSRLVRIGWARRAPMSRLPKMQPIRLQLNAGHPKRLGYMQMTVPMRPRPHRLGARSRLQPA